MRRKIDKNGLFALDKMLNVKRFCKKMDLERDRAVSDQ